MNHFKIITALRGVNEAEYVIRVNIESEEYLEIYNRFSNENRIYFTEEEFVMHLQKIGKDAGLYKRIL